MALALPLRPKRSIQLNIMSNVVENWLSGTFMATVECRELSSCPLLKNGKTTQN